MALEYVDRKAIKEAVFTVLFTSNHFLGQEEAKPKKLFKQLFPIVYKVLAHLKRKDKTLLACLLQRIEAHLILNVITKRIAQERPNLMISSIHDSIITTEGDEKYVESVMQEELTKYIGMTPTLKLDYWK